MISQYQLPTGLVGDNACYVDGVHGNDATAIRGSTANKFATIQAALNTIQDGDVVYIASGTYTENLTMPSKDKITIIGAGQNSTFITNSGSSDTFSWIHDQSKTIERFTMRDLTINNTSAGNTGLKLDGSTSTTVDALSNGATPSGIINVSDNTNFPSAGVLNVTTAFQTTAAAASNNAVLSKTTTLTSGGALPLGGTVPVVSTAGFSTSGTLTIETTSGGTATITYTGVTATTFTGCTGTGTVATGGVVTAASITVASTTGFATTGTIIVQTSTPTAFHVVTYTGKTATTFTGCSRGVGPSVILTGNTITQFVQQTILYTGKLGLTQFTGCTGGSGTSVMLTNNPILLSSIFPTTIAVASNGLTLPQSTINVASTAAFPTAGIIIVQTSSPSSQQVVTYTGKTATTFTGCTGGSGASIMVTGNSVTLFPSFAGIVFEFERILINKTNTGDAAFFRRCTTLNFNQCTFYGLTTSTTRLKNSNATFRQSTLAALDVTYKNSDPTPLITIGRTGVYLTTGTTISVGGPIVLREHPIFATDVTCVTYGTVTTLDTTTLYDATELTTSTSPAHGPLIYLQGVTGSPLIPGSGAITINLPTWTVTSILDISEGQFFGTITLNAKAALRFPVLATRTRFWNINASGQAVSGSVTLGDYINLYAKGATAVTQNLYTVSTSTNKAAVDRDQHTIQGVAVIGLGVVTVAINPPFPSIAAATSGSGSISPTPFTLVTTGIVGFPTSGSLLLGCSGTGNFEIVNYTGISGSSFTGCTSVVSTTYTGPAPIFPSNYSVQITPRGSVAGVDPRIVNEVAFMPQFPYAALGVRATITGTVDITIQKFA